ncbi:MAG: DMT family transporter [Colwellia sp.]|nr:DMT family transporter [Colwellia sp.]
MNIKYALIMMFGVQLLAAFSSVLVKQLGTETPIYQLILYRQAFALIILLPVLMALPGGLTISPFLKLHLFRGLLITVGNVTFLMALIHLPLVTVTAVVYTSPIILVLISAYLLAEKLSQIKIITVCAGFCGVLMISRPSEMNIYIVLALVSAITLALNSVCLKRIANKEHPMVTLFWSNIYTVAFIMPLAFWEEAPMSITLLSTGFYLALLYIGMTYLVIHALRRADASRLASAEYSGLVFAAVLGYWLFDDPIELWTLTGIIIVIGSVLLPEKFKKRNQLKIVSHNDI